jgi:NOL1/NOP2/fmu family ribosome biogenesis protein
MLLPGGTLVYSTCTFSREENEDNIDWFLSQHPEFSVKVVDAPWFEKDERQGTFRLWPQKLCGEGHFVAVMKKAGDLPDDAKMPGCDVQNMYEKPSRKNADKKGGKNLSGLDKVQMQALEEFCTSSIAPEIGAWILNGNLTLFGDQLYRLPGGAPDLKGLRVLRAGLHIGEFKKNRFEPSHALALLLGADEANSSVSFSAEDVRIAGFLRGESIFLQESDLRRGADKGWCLVCVDGCSIGWGKLAGGQIKNHYPKGLRREI